MAQGSTRFEHLEKSIDDYIIEQQNKNIRAKTTRDVKLLIEFLREKHDQRNPEDIEAEELNEYLCEFILSMKRKDGKDFEPSSLRGMFSSFNRHLKECKYPVSVIEDVVFERARKCLEAKNKQLKKEGKGNRPNAAEALKPGSHLCDKHNTSDISISISTRKKELFLFSCAYAYAYAYVACVMLIAQVGTRLKVSP